MSTKTIEVSKSLSPSTARPPIFDGSLLFQERFNRRPFMFSHSLADHSLFELDSLGELCRSLRRKNERNVTFYLGNRPVTQGWKDPSRRSLTVEEGMKQIQESDSWILLKSVQQDYEYRALLERAISELEDLTGTQLRRQITWPDAYIFIASPGSVTPYHFDHESNFLLQIHGEKDVNLFAPEDRSILSEEEIERYYVGYLSSATYRDEVQSKAEVFHLTPGLGVHHPVRAPHWVKNGSEYSVSFSIPLCLRQYDLQARVYQANHYLRKLGLSPTPPGRSPWRDSIKMSILGLPRLRKPRTKYELLRYGIAPVLLGRWVSKRLKRHGRRR